MKIERLAVKVGLVLGFLFLIAVFNADDTCHTPGCNNRTSDGNKYCYVCRWEERKAAEASQEKRYYNSEQITTAMQMILRTNGKMTSMIMMTLTTIGKMSTSK